MTEPEGPGRFAGGGAAGLTGTGLEAGSAGPDRRVAAKRLRQRNRSGTRHDWLANEGCRLPRSCRPAFTPAWPPTSALRFTAVPFAMVVPAPPSTSVPPSTTAPFAMALPAPPASMLRPASLPSAPAPGVSPGAALPSTDAAHTTAAARTGANLRRFSPLRIPASPVPSPTLPSTTAPPSASVLRSASRLSAPAPAVSPGPALPSVDTAHTTATARTGANLRRFKPLRVPASPVPSLMLPSTTPPPPTPVPQSASRPSAPAVSPGAVLPSVDTAHTTAANLRNPILDLASPAPSSPRPHAQATEFEP